MKKWLYLPLMAALLLCGCAREAGETTPAKQTAQVFAMDTVMDLTVYGDDAAAHTALQDAESEINRLDALLSRQNEESEIAAVNRGAGEPVEVDPEVLALLKTAVGYYEMTDGALDITVAPLMDAWNFTGDTPRVPDRAELDALLTHVGADRIIFGDDTVTLEPGMAVDLGGIAKGYTSDCLAEVFARDGISSAMVSLGGNVYVCGTKPDGTAWNVAVEDPNDTGAYLGVVQMQDAFAITSGGYQRYFERDGVRYYHILDPKTGDVARSGLTSVTVICQNGTMGDALSTALFVMGCDKAVDFWRTSGLDFDMILMDENGTVYLTEGLKDRFDASLAEHEYEYTYLNKNG